MGADARAHRRRRSRASPFVRATKARAVKVKLDRKVRYELDGGDRTKVKIVQGQGRDRVRCRLCVPRGQEGG